MSHDHLPLDHLLTKGGAGESIYIVTVTLKKIRKREAKDMSFS
jgi:hypothetical protein